MSTFPEERKNLLSKLPFPLANLYQKILIDISKFDNQNSNFIVWEILDCSSVFLKVISICGLCHYIDIAKSLEEQEHD